jgi:hypothetical protein
MRQGLDAGREFHLLVRRTLVTGRLFVVRNLVALVVYDDDPEANATTPRPGVGRAVGEDVQRPLVEVHHRLRLRAHIRKGYGDGLATS